MKSLLMFVLLLSFLSGCTSNKEVYETEIKTYVISHKEIVHYSKVPDSYILYFQTNISTEAAEVTQETYDKYKLGDTIQVLIKYWEKPKKK